MAFSTTKVTSTPVMAIRQTVWTLADTAGSSASEQFGDCSAITVQMTGTWSSATVAMQCSNDDTTWAALPTALSMSANGLNSVAANSLGFRYYRATMSGGGAGSSITVGLCGQLTTAAVIRRPR